MHYHYKPHYSLISWIKIVIGSVIAAASFRFFSYPNDIVAGGITGIAQILNRLIGTPVGVMVIVMNIPIFIICFRKLGIKSVIGVSTTANHLRELADRYKEAQVAIDVGRVFEADKSIINYENLGLGRIIYQLPTTLCEMFLNEVFKKNPIETLDEDTLETINKFFENNLNVSETSRKLYVHRNTLVSRLEKIKKLTGLDLREFDHAIVFKVAMMVKMYLDSLNASKY